MRTMTFSYQELLYTDFDGNSPPADGEGADGVMLDGLEDARRVDRIEGLVALSQDEQYPSDERYVALRALAAWAEPTGLQGVIDAARLGTAVPWYRSYEHRLWGCDATFEGLALSVFYAEDMAPDRGTADLRHAAELALLELADTEYFESYLAMNLRRDLTPDVAASIDRIITRTTATWREGRRPGFPLVAQAADLAAVLVRYDEPLGVAHARSLAALELFDMRTLTGLIGVVAAGRASESMQFADELRQAAGPAAEEYLQEALKRRAA
jgi:hypothetical protein